MKARMLLLIVVTALISTAVTYNVTKGKTSANTAAAVASAPEEKGAKIPGIQIAPAVTGEGWDTLAVTGRVTVPSDGLVKISPRIEGKVVAVRGTAGDTVRRGQVLAVVSSVALAEARAQYRQAQSRLEAARRNLERESQIAELGANSARPVEEARSESLEAQGSVADAKSELAQAKIELATQETELAQCMARLARARELYSDKIISKQDMESAEAELKKDSAAVDAAKSRVTQTEAKIARAISRAEIAKQYLSREQNIYKGRMLDLRALQSAKAEVASAAIEAQAASDRIRVLGADPGGSGDTLAVVSPINGRIASRHISIGEMATPSDVLFTVANLSRIWIEADVYEKDLAKVRLGQPAEVRVDAYPDRVFSGKVDSIGDILSSESRTAKIRCVVANSGNLLRGEMFANVSLVTAKRGSTVLIPRQAVLDDAGNKVVFTPCLECPEDKKAGTNACGAYDKLEVKTASTHGDKIEVLSGVEPGIQVVTVGAYQLKTAMGSGKLEAGCTGH